MNEENYEGWPEEWDQADKQRFDEWFSNYRKEKNTMEENKVIVDELADIEAKEVAEEKEANLLAAFAAAGEGLVAGFQKFMHVGNGRIGKHQKSKRGAIHNHKHTFKSRKILPMTPSQYRHFHFGAKQKEG